MHLVIYIRNLVTEVLALEFINLNHNCYADKLTPTCQLEKVFIGLTDLKKAEAS